MLEAFYHEGNDDLGCLLLHGFTGSPSEMRFLGEKLAAYGWTVNGIMLSGHGTTPEDMVRTGWKDWARDAEAGVRGLRRHCSRVAAIGLSMGGLLSVYLAEKGLVDAVISMNTPMVLQDWRARLAGLAKPFVHYVAKAEVSGRLAAERFAYGKIPLRPLDSLNKAVPGVRRKLGLVRCPVLVMQSRRDKTVSPRSADILWRGLSGARTERIFWENSGHILTLGPEREAVALETARFLQTMLGAG
ncbi:Alpha/Beta hydrolase fold [Acididesulfobacillus acetoxydans]|uniref:Alpha/Beta hydrolase fold n=1 Tax=Acididesulfobacillus acetoxydans TaxID=1561005 RepID=A0A8S0XUS1_9FIRM|nr:Alpha/Beta hydrolase fold [Acididesulfobacillus acetoxydans]CEJ06229.1 Esterase/lipase [Acididesulfobacillus acetoxydans]